MVGLDGAQSKGEGRATCISELLKGGAAAEEDVASARGDRKRGEVTERDALLPKAPPCQDKSPPPPPP
jgi:hypothetical protein